jgi:hypothetical protein
MSLFKEISKFIRIQLYPTEIEVFKMSKDIDNHILKYVVLNREK